MPERSSKPLLSDKNKRAKKIMDRITGPEPQPELPRGAKYVPPAEPRGTTPQVPSESSAAPGRPCSRRGSQEGLAEIATVAACGRWADKRPQAQGAASEAPAPRTPTAEAFDGQEELPGVPSLPRVTAGYFITNTRDEIAGVHVAFKVRQDYQWDY